ncbi:MULTISPECIES: SDR family NAD(P)-dependent oxidoreductase [Pseudofrankia]|uniref:SDR family NAD(P)-dependent oxidoreductase n=1 Tax=Pseudofrankia TaxID=2994363 RepID=UPI000234B0EC|nr:MULTISPECIES: SDR family oxidoreductase [Pseudofrankia]OHV32252.1 short-chain dehydrogenase [Pseudofrankia sp. EUN1h]
MGRLDGQVALVTGAGQGVGRGIAHALAREGARVAVSGRRAEPLDTVVKELVDLGARARALAVTGDVGVRADADRMAAATVAEFGALDILVNNAQSSVQVRLEQTTDADVELAWRSGALGTLYCMQACLPHLKERGGSIVNFGSSTGVRGDTTFGSYAMAKEAIRGLSRVAAREWGRYGIRVNVICPTATSPAAEEYREANPERFAMVMREIPLGRFGDPETDIGRAVAALVSDDMSYLTGATLMLGGGREVQ